jgi:hypothetical protein
MVPAHPAQRPHARAPLRVPQRRRQSQARTPTPHPRRAHPTATARTGAARYQVRLLCQAHATRRPHRSTGPLAADAQRHSAQARPPTHDSMNPGSLQPRRRLSQRANLAGKSTSSKGQTEILPPHIPSELGSAKTTRPPVTTQTQRTAAQVLTGSGLKPEANRINTTRFDGVRP